MTSKNSKKIDANENSETTNGQSGLMIENSRESRLFIKSIEKGILVLKAFDGTREQLSLSEISAITGMDISSAQRCIYTLCALGYLHKDPRTRNYELSVRVLDFAFHFLVSNALTSRAFPYLQQLSNETEETVTLTVLDGTEIVMVLRLMSRHVLVRSIMVGTRLPAFCTSSGLAMLAHLPQEQADEILKRSNLIKHTPQTINDPQVIRERLEHVRQKGYAITREEYYLGDISISSAITDTLGFSIGAVNIAVSKSRWGGDDDERRISRLVVEAAAVISKHGKHS
jgi:IclR family pca regulon transcriptional regulator